MRRAATGSIVVHGVIAIALLAIPREPVPAPIEDARVELVEIVPTSAALTNRDGTPGGGTPATVKTEAPRETATRDVRVPHRSKPTGDHPMRVADLIGSQTIERPGDGGMGRGRGGGVGGEEGGVDGGVSCDAICMAGPPPPPAPPPPPPPEKRSRARVAKLIFPMRQRDVDADSQLFVAAVTVDEDGYVVGARLVRGFGGVADRRAEDAIWRFRYEPARDPDGRAIRTRFEQQFLVQ